MQCDDCDKVYIGDTIKTPCPKCGGNGTVLVDITGHYYSNRAARRKAKAKIEKYLPCPECTLSKEVMPLY